MNNKRIFLLIIIIFCLQIDAQTVTTVADGALDDAIAIDSNNNLYVSNFTGDSVFKITEAGTVSPFVTGLETPNGLAFDSQDNLYVCDWDANMIFKYDISGNQLDAISVTGNPSGIVKSQDNDDMIFTTYSGNTINLLPVGGAPSEISSDSELNGPVGITYNAQGDLFVGNFNDRKILKILPNGDTELIAQLPSGSNAPNLGFISYSQGWIWGTILGQHKIYRVNPNATNEYEVYAGSIQGNADGTIATATFNSPNGILGITGENKLYVTDFGSKNLRIIENVLTIEEDQLIQTSIKVLPNPAKNLLMFIATQLNSGNYNLEVLDQQGRVLLKKSGLVENSKVEEQIDIASWSAGIYLINFQVGNKQSSRKFIIE